MAMLAPLQQRAAPRRPRTTTLGLLAAAAGALWLAPSSDAFTGGSQALQTRSPAVACGIHWLNKQNKRRKREWGAEIMGQNMGKDCSEEYLRNVVAQGRRKEFIHRLESWGKKKPNPWEMREARYKKALAKTILNRNKAVEAKANYVKPELILMRDYRPIEDCRNAFEQYAKQPDIDHNKGSMRRKRDTYQYHVYEEDAEWAREHFPKSKAMLWDKVRPSGMRDPKSQIRDLEEWDRRKDLVQVYPRVRKNTTLENDGFIGYHRRYAHKDKERAHIKALLDARIAARQAAKAEVPAVEE